MNKIEEKLTKEIYDNLLELLQKKLKNYQKQSNQINVANVLIYSFSTTLSFLLFNFHKKDNDFTRMDAYKILEEICEKAMYFFEHAMERSND